MIEIGQFHKEWGVRGQVLGHFHNPRSTLISRLDSLYLDTQKLSLLGPPKPHGGAHVFTLRGISTPETARALRGKPFCCPRDRFPASDADNFYWVDVMGAEVWDDQGQYWGILERLEGSESYFYLVIRSKEGRELLYPAHAQKVQRFDRGTHRLLIEAIEGLRDD